MKIFTKFLLAAFLGLVMSTSLKAQCSLTVSTGYVQNFDTFATCGTSCATVCALPAGSGWVNSTSDDRDWLVDAGGTTSFGTGPSAGNTTGSSTDNYLYLETSSPCSNDTARLISPCFDLTNNVCPALEVDYHMFGADQNLFNVKVSGDGGVTFVTRFTVSGDQGNQWNKAIVDLSGLGNTVIVMLEGIGGSSFESDLAIDNATLVDLNSQTFNASFSGLPASISNVGAPVTLTPVESGGSFSGPGVTGNTFSPIGLAAGSYTITYTIGPGACAATSSQTVQVTGVQCDTTISALPYTQDFESYGTCVGSCNTTCPLGAGWTNLSTDSNDWTVDFGGTTSSLTGPSVDLNPGTSTGNYIYIETSVPCENSRAILLSPCFDLSNTTCPVLDFGYHQYGEDQGTLTVEVSTDQGNTWNAAFSSTGDKGDQWLRAIVDLTSYIGSTVRFRFIGDAGPSFESDLALDDIQIREFGSVSGAFTGLPATTSVIDQPATLVPTTPGGTFSGTGVTGNTFDPAAAGPGTYTITYTVGPASCGASSSQTVTVTPIACSATFTLPYAEDFETFPTCVASCDSACPLPAASGWVNVGNDDNDWIVDEGGTPSFGTGPAVDNSTGTATGNYLYVESSFPCNDQEIILVSPCIDLGSASCPVFSFAYHADGFGQGPLEVDISTDNGNTWANAFRTIGDQGDVWNSAIIDLTAFAGQTVRFRIVADSMDSSGDVAIDDVEVFDFSASAAFTGLPATLSIIDAPVTLTPVTAGGTFSATGGLTGNVFDPGSVAPGSYAVTYSVGPASCGSSTTDTIVVTGIQCNTNVKAIPYVEDFETFTTCANSCTVVCPLTNGWTNLTTDDNDWIVDAGGTSSFDTGPGQDLNPGTTTGNYLFTEASGCSGDSSVALSPCIDLGSNPTCPVLSFGYHMFGGDMGTLKAEISTDQGNNWTNVFTLSGDQGDQWNVARVDLAGYTGLIRIRFIGTRGPSFESDMAIDDIRVEDQLNIDPSFTGLPTGFPAIVKITDPIVNLNAATPGGTWSISPASAALNGNQLDPSQLTVLPFPQQYTVKYVVGGGVCVDSSSSSFFVTDALCTGTRFTPPYTQNFDSWPGCTPNCGTACPLPVADGWLNVLFDDTDWTVDSAGTTSGSTGPTTGNTTGANNDKYLYIETSFPCDTGVTANLYTPCFDLRGGQCPVVSFDYHQFGIDQGTLRFFASTDDGNSWDTLFVSSGDQGNQWNTATIDVSAYLSAIATVFRFEGSGNTGFGADVAIDNFSVIEFLNADPSFAGLPGSAICSSSDPITLTPVTPGGTFSGPGVTGNVFDPAGSGVGSSGGIVTITYTVGPQACAQTSNQVVQIKPVPVITASADVTICQGGSATLSASSASCPNPGQAFFNQSLAEQLIVNDGDTLRFSFPGTAIGSGDATLTINARGDIDIAGLEEFEIFDENGNSLGVTNTGSQCDVNPSQTVINVPAATVNTWAANGSIDFVVVADPSINTITCDSNGVSLDLSYPIGGCGFQWNTGETTSSITVSPSSSTDFTVTVIDSSGCVATDTVRVNVRPAPFIDAGSDQTICEGESVTLRASAGSPGGSGAQSLSTTFLDNNGANGNMFDVTALNTVTINGMAGHFSSATADVQIYVRTAPYAGAEATASGWTLLGTSGSFTTNGSGSATNIPINFSVTIPAGATYSFYMYATTGSVNYTDGTSEGSVFVTDGNISILEGIGRGLSTVDPFAGGQFRPRIWNGTLFYDAGTGNNSSSVNFMWSTGATTDSIVVSPTTTTTYAVQTTDTFGCSNVDSVTVTVNPNPTFTLDVSNISCNGFGDGSIGIVNPNQSFVQDTVVPGAQQTVFSSTLTRGYWFVAPTDFVITSLRVPSDFSTDPQYIQIMRINGVLPTFGTTTSNFTTLGYFSNVAGTGQIAVNIPVNTGDTIGILGARSSNGTTMDNSYTAGPFNTTIAGFPVTLTRLITQQSLNTPAASIANSTGQLSRVEFTINGGSAFQSMWSGPNGFNSMADTITNLMPGTYAVTVTNQNTGCTTTDSATISEPAALTVDAGDCEIIYPGYTGPGSITSTQLDATVSGGTMPYSYLWSDGSTSASITVSPMMTTTYYVTVTDANGCSDSAAVNVAVDNVACTDSLGNAGVRICCAPVVIGPQLCDFDRDPMGTPLPAGTVLTNQYAAEGVHISAVNNRNGHPDKALIFNSSSPTGGDYDLGTPNQAFFGPGIGSGGNPSNNVPLGNLVIIAEDDVDADNNGLVDDPDDEARGGQIKLQFDCPFTIYSIVLVDVDDGTGGSVIACELENGGTTSVPIPNLGDNSVVTLPIGVSKVKSLTISLKGSGALAAFSYKPDTAEFCVPMARIQDYLALPFVNLGSCSNICDTLPAPTFKFGTDPSQPASAMLDEMLVSAFPNPTSGELNVRLECNGCMMDRRDVKLTMTDQLGHRVYNISYEMYSDFIEYKVDMREFSEGIYFLNIQAGNETWTKKIVKF